MPNYCENELSVVGKDEDVEEVFDFIESNYGAFDFNTIVPYPENYRLRDQEYEDCETEADRKAFVEKWGDWKNGYNSGGYDWCREHWSTKWNAIRPRRFENKMFFMTAWGPPTNVIIALAKRFCEVSFHLEYFEGGVGFCGGFSCLGEHDWYREDEFEAGRKVNQWECEEYKGDKGE